MAKNWSAAEAARVVVEGTDKAAIMDIGKRFPLFVSAAARGQEGLLEIIGALNPERITARTIESKLKEGIDEDAGEDEEEEEKPAKKAPTKGKTPPAKRGTNKKAAKEEEPEDDEDWDDEEEDEEEEKPKRGSKGKTPPAKGKTPPAKGKKKPDPEPEEDEDDEDEDEDNFDEMSLSELRAAAKKQKINTKGMAKDAIIAALRGEEDEDEEDEDDDEDWDL